jgi:8-oxo-dGTP pyrophosphatase MutT (NUDIX family)
MNVIAEFREQDINPGASLIDSSEFDHREAVRAVVVNDSGQVALLNVSKRGFHKLPGGGIESDEDNTEALAREVLEEIGCEIEIVAELGEVIEYRDEWRQIQTSYCYSAKQIGEQRQSSLTDKERKEGFEIIWAKDLDEAVAILEADSPSGYDGKRMKPRDLAILRAAKMHLSQG